MKKSIDINCDLGEGMHVEEAIMPYISSANIACGYHAGDAALIRRTIRLCLEFDVSIGAHPSFNDRKNFGRTEMEIPEEEIYLLVQEQIGIIAKIAAEEGGVVRHVKPHGALYNMAARDAKLASVIVSAIQDTDKALILYGLSGSQLIVEGRKSGLRVANEIFADRTYQDDGSLTSRWKPGAMINDVNEVLAQISLIVQSGRVRTLSGKMLSIEADTICIHGDGPHAVEFAKAVHEGLGKEGYSVSTT